MRLYHSTTARRASRIMRDGFRDAKGYYGFRMLHTGVWFSDVPVGVNEGAKGEPGLGDPVIVIEIAENQISHFERSTVGWPYREWCLPAELVNRVPRRVIRNPLDRRERRDWWNDC
jgi:hypothetical protein